MEAQIIQDQKFLAKQVGDQRYWKQYFHSFSILYQKQTHISQEGHLEMLELIDDT